MDKIFFKNIEDELYVIDKFIMGNSSFRDPKALFSSTSREIPLIDGEHFFVCYYNGDDYTKVPYNSIDVLMSKEIRNAQFIELRDEYKTKIHTKLIGNEHFQPFGFKRKLSIIGMKIVEMLLNHISYNSREDKNLYFNNPLIRNRGVKQLIPSYVVYDNFEVDLVQEALSNYGIYDLPLDCCVKIARKLMEDVLKDAISFIYQEHDYTFKIDVTSINLYMERDKKLKEIRFDEALNKR
jgi:hypothetical protein